MFLPWEFHDRFETLSPARCYSCCYRFCVVSYGPVTQASASWPRPNRVQKMVPAKQTPLNVLPRVTACNHVSTAPVARPTAFGPRQYSVWHPQLPARKIFVQHKNFFARPPRLTASNFPAACKRVLNASVSRLHRVLFTFNGVCFAGTIFWTIFGRGQDAKGCVTGTLVLEWDHQYCA